MPGRWWWKCGRCARTFAMPGNTRKKIYKKCLGWQSISKRCTTFCFMQSEREEKAYTRAHRTMCKCCRRRCFTKAQRPHYERASLCVRCALNAPELEYEITRTRTRICEQDSVHVRARHIFAHVVRSLATLATTAASDGRGEGVSGCVCVYYLLNAKRMTTMCSVHTEKHKGTSEHTQLHMC